VCRGEQWEMLWERWSPGVLLAETCETISHARAH
jgi:hypothetical protein